MATDEEQENQTEKQLPKGVKPFVVRIVLYRKRAGIPDAIVSRSTLGHFDTAEEARKKTLEKTGVKL